jgi:hypothetical protein
LLAFVENSIRKLMRGALKVLDFAGEPAVPTAKNTAKSAVIPSAVTAFGGLKVLLPFALLDASIMRARARR